MPNNKKSHKKISIENHETAAFANIKKVKPVTNVPITGEFSASNAKDWVDENEK
ncbi:hypothetical protein J2Z42_002356 [Clostridium algifaecis]|uniref:DUF3787 domain-containing protein n=1 Tax=Clostridium algifaecis TaxID=1472040 RepID=A0ABS4KUC3_9CLOT|nr:DUF3787 domain-containing protein [Clostridium algifaecis]MBP2033649.1 hypothetical protein [Clostridium algifaecis]